MEHVIIGIVIVVVIVVGTIVFWKNKKNTLDGEAKDIQELKNRKDAYTIPANSEIREQVIKVEMLPAESLLYENKLVEIKDNKVLARVNHLVPELAQIGNLANNAAQAVRENGEVLYSVIIPAGAKLADSRAVDGAVRGFYRGAENIRGQANFVAVEAKKVQRL